MNETLQRRQILKAASAQLGLLAIAGCAPSMNLRPDNQREVSGVIRDANELALVKPLELMPLPFSESALAPVISANTMKLHHGKHHKAYVDALRRIEAAHPGSISRYSLRELVVLMWTADADARVAFQNAAQHYNHCIQWLSLSPNGGGQPPQTVEEALTQSFGGVPQFQQAWLDKAMSVFGSGWVWLVHSVRSGQLEILPTSNADTPITKPGLTVLGNLDVWEHSHQPDYPGDRKSYVKSVMDKVFDWHFVESQLIRARQLEKLSNA